MVTAYLLFCAHLISATCSAEPGPATQSWYGGQPPLKADDQRRHLFRPYNAVTLNTLAGNYCDNLLDGRINITSYTHQDFDSNRLDAWHLQFPDDAARIVEGLVWEDRYSGVARLETVRRITKGLLAAHIPGTQAYHFFRHRSAGKTYLIFDDSAGANQGRLLMSMWGDEVQGDVSVGFRAQFDGAWLEPKDFKYADTPEKAGVPSVARDARYWNMSPFRFERRYTGPNHTVQFAGRYWLSDEDRPLEFTFEAPKAQAIAVNIGEPGMPMPLLADAKAPGIIEFADRKTVWHSDKDGDQTLSEPAFNYLVLRKPATWACPGYSSALLVMWQGKAKAIEAVAENGYGQIRVVYGAAEEKARACVWLYPFRWVNEDDMEYVFRNAQSFLAQGHFMQNGFPSQQLVNAIPAGLAAAAVLLSKYNDPFAETARIEAANAVDAFLEPEKKGRWFARGFFEVKAAAWMVELGKAINDKAMVAKYTEWVRLAMDRMLSGKLGYDGKAWADGWGHFNCMKAAWLAYEATGDKAYRDAYERAMEIYTIDKNGVYRNGEALKAPGGFDVYAGALPMAVWGHWGLKERVEQLINLQVPNGWHHPTIPVADLWNDAGAGPWSQDDANPDMLGYMLRGYDLPKDPKRLLPTGAFPKFTFKPDGGVSSVEVTRAPVVDNPFFVASQEEVVTLKDGAVPPPRKVKAMDVDLGEQDSKAPSIERSLPVGKATGAALDLRVARGQYLVEVSADGATWWPRLDTWCDSPTTRSLDLSFLVGGRDELVHALTVMPPDDTAWLVRGGEANGPRREFRAVTGDQSFVYRFALPHVERCFLELLVANDYRVDLSKDGKEWQEVLSPGQITPSKSDNQQDAAWLRMVDATKYANDQGEVYMQFRSGGNDAAFGGAAAFLRRAAVYASYRCSEIHVRVKKAPFSRPSEFAAEWMRLRAWE